MENIEWIPDREEIRFPIYLNDVSGLRGNYFIPIYIEHGGRALRKAKTLDLLL